ncbi:MAG: sigma-70 family RNA polymerase sigma factor [Lachnospiraceae bacterium]
MIPIVILAIQDESDREYMTHLYENYKNLMYSEILKISPNSQYKEDILNDSLVKLIGKVELLRALDRSRLVNYIITTVRNTAIDSFRKSDKYINFEYDFDTEMGTDEDLVERAVLGKMRIEQFTQLWHTLDEGTREILEDKYILELSDRKIAENLGIKPASVRMKLARARASAYKQLEKQMN